VVLEIAQEFGMSSNEANLTRYDLFTADEFFLTGTAAEIIPVVDLDSRPIGDGIPGPLTAKFIKRYHELTQASGAPIY
jgi:branched-chain amino acid aminotransferase